MSDHRAYSQEEWQEIEEKIHNLLIEHRKFLASESGSKVVELDQSRLGRLARIDAIQGQQAMKKQVRNIEREVKALEATLRRMKHVPEDFGYCVDCDECIPFLRVLFRPVTRRCISCAQEHEKQT